MIEKKTKKAGKKININQKVCIGCGTCVSIAPKYFELDDDGVSSVIKQYDIKDDKIIKEAVDSCPVDAISLK